MIDDDRRVEGVLHLHDLWRTGWCEEQDPWTSAPTPPLISARR
ncbi:MAG: hypothetical protein R2712_04665 [Vicinamibacterales bacterium]